jgi:hypothetical protein
MLVLDTHKMEWVNLYDADPELCPPGQPIGESAPPLQASPSVSQLPPSWPAYR